MIPDKNTIRSKYKALRLNLSDQEWEGLSGSICENAMRWILESPDFQHYHLFLPIARQREIDTFPLLYFLKSNKKHVYTSRIRGGVMETVLIGDNPSFSEDAWGIPVPDIFELVSPELIQVVFVPLLAFDKAGNRIGFGKGFYDIFLSSLDKRVLRVGLAYAPPEEKLPSEPHDVPLDMVITPSMTMEF